MQLYRFTPLKEHFYQQHKDAEEVREFVRFFQKTNMFDNLNIKNIYLHREKENEIYINENDLSKACLLASMRYGRVFDYSDMKSVSLSDDMIRFPVNSSDGIIDAIREHNQSPLLQEKKRLLDEKRAQDRAIRQTFGNIEQDFSDKKVAAIDFEYSTGKGRFNFDGVYEFGVTICDKGVNHYHHYLVEGAYENKSHYKNELQFKFMFGDTKIIRQDEIKAVLQELLDGTDIYLFHDYSNDLRFLTNNGFDIDYRKVPCLLDTQYIYQQNFSDDPKAQAKSLKDILRTFDIDFNYLHNAGNDAAYTMQSFIKMSELKPEAVLTVKAGQETKRSYTRSFS